MGPFTLTTTIDAPRERIFDFICDLGIRQAWTDHFASEYRLARIPAEGVGAAARFRVGGPAGIDWMETVIAEANRPYEVIEHCRGGRLDRTPMRVIWELREGPTTTVALTFLTKPTHPFDRVREFGRSRWWRRRWAKALRRMRESIESGTEAPRAEVAGGDRLPTVAA